jgi:hypothetical protein
MATPIVVQAYIQRLCRETGTDADTVYSKKTGAWYFLHGTSTIEVFITSHLTSHGTVRTFLRCFSPLQALPLTDEKKFKLFRAALELNEEHLGIKLAIDNKKEAMCVIGERDTDGMDYEEMVTTIIDTGDLAQKLNHLMKSYFEK